MGDGGLVQSMDEVGRTQMRVALQHFELAMTRDRTDLGNVQALLEQARDRLVAQVVEVKV